MGTRRAAAVFTLACAAAAACNSLNGVEDLRIDPSTTSASDAAVDSQASVPGADGSVPPPPSSSDASQDATGIDACAPGATPSVFIGEGASKLGGTFIELTPVDNGHAGGVLTSASSTFDDFTMTFEYSLTYTNNPAAGIAFVAYSSNPAGIACQPGPYICALGTKVPGFAVLLRTARAVANDPEPPYVAVVDADVFPDTLPIPTPVDPAKSYHLLTTIDSSTIPPVGTWDKMSIVAKNGLVTLSLDGTTYLTNAPIPGWAKGRSWRWGIIAATGAGNAGHRTAIRNLSFSSCF